MTERTPCDCGPMADLSFYSTSAQIIPVLYLALAFQNRGMFKPFFEEDIDRSEKELRDYLTQRLNEDSSLTPEEKFTRLERWVPSLDHLRRRLRVFGAIGMLAVTILFCVAEAFALRVLDTERPDDLAAGVIQVALWIGAGVLVAPLFKAQVDRVAEHVPYAKQRRFALVGFSVGLTLALCLFAYGF